MNCLGLCTIRNEVTCTKAQLCMLESEAEDKIINVFCLLIINILVHTKLFIGGTFVLQLYKSAPGG